MPLSTQQPLPVPSDAPKTCSQCHQPKPLADFPKHNRRRSGYNSMCSACLNARHRAWYAKNPRPPQNGGREARKTGETRTCAVCGQSFYRPGSYLRTPGRHLWCSPSCRTQGQRRGTYRRCEQCEQSFYAYPCRSVAQTWPSTSTPAQRFCSGQCKAIYFREHPEASGRYQGGRWPSYGPNWRTQRRLARERDNHTCQKCGRRQLRPRLDVHHIRPRRDFGDDYLAGNALANLITLCRVCHLETEHAETDVRRRQ